MKSFKERVLEAFEDVRLPDELFGLEATEALEIEAALRPFGRWTEIPQAFMEKFSPALSLTKPGAYPFLLPAFMLYGVALAPDDEHDVVCLGLAASVREPESEGYCRERLAALSPQQRSLLLEYLTVKSNTDKFSLAAMARGLAARLIEELDAKHA